MKNGYTKIFFSDPKSADLTSSKYKPSNNSEDHEEIKNVPHVFISFNCLGNSTSGSGNLYFRYFIITRFITCDFLIVSAV